MPLSESIRRRLVSALASVDDGDELADFIDDAAGDGTAALIAAAAAQAAAVAAQATADAHKARHLSGGADAFAATDLIEAVVKRLRESGGQDLLIGAIADGQILQRSGTGLIGVALSGGKYFSTTVYLDPGGNGDATTMADAVALLSDGDTLEIAGGNIDFVAADFSAIFTTSGCIRGQGRGVTVLRPTTTLFALKFGNGNVVIEDLTIQQQTSSASFSAIDGNGSGTLQMNRVECDRDGLALAAYQVRECVVYMRDCKLDANGAAAAGCVSTSLVDAANTEFISYTGATNKTAVVLTSNSSFGNRFVGCQFRNAGGAGFAIICSGVLGIEVEVSGCEFHDYTTAVILPTGSGTRTHMNVNACTFDNCAAIFGTCTLGQLHYGVLCTPHDTANFASDVTLWQADSTGVVVEARANIGLTVDVGSSGTTLRHDATVAVLTFAGVGNITLPPIAKCIARRIVVMDGQGDAGASTKTIIPNGAEPLLGLNTITSNYGSRTYVVNAAGTGWISES